MRVKPPVTLGLTKVGSRRGKRTTGPPPSTPKSQSRHTCPSFNKPGPSPKRNVRHLDFFLLALLMIVVGVRAAQDNRDLQRGTASEKASAVNVRFAVEAGEP